MRVVIDASVVLDLGGDDMSQLDSELQAPGLIDYEVAQGTRRLLRLGVLDPDVADAFIESFPAWEITRHPATRLLDRIWSLRENLTAYDAAYVSLAETLGVPLWTHDLRLARAADPYCDVLTG